MEPIIDLNEYGLTMLNAAIEVSRRHDSSPNPILKFGGDNIQAAFEQSFSLKIPRATGELDTFREAVKALGQEALRECSSRAEKFLLSEIYNKGTQNLCLDKGIASTGVPEALKEGGTLQVLLSGEAQQGLFFPDELISREEADRCVIDSSIARFRQESNRLNSVSFREGYVSAPYEAAFILDHGSFQVSSISISEFKVDHVDHEDLLKAKVYMTVMFNPSKRGESWIFARCPVDNNFLSL